MYYNPNAFINIVIIYMIEIKRERFDEYEYIFIFEIDMNYINNFIDMNYINNFIEKRPNNTMLVIFAYEKDIMDNVPNNFKGSNYIAIYQIPNCIYNYEDFINQYIQKLIKVLNKPVKDFWHIAGVDKGKLNIT